MPNQCFASGFISFPKWFSNNRILTFCIISAISFEEQKKLGLVRRSRTFRTWRIWDGRVHCPGAVGQVVAVLAAVSWTEPGCVQMVVVVVVVSSEKASLQQLDYFIVWKGHVRHIQAQHLGNDHPEIRQLERRKAGEKSRWAEGRVKLKLVS